jgi:hypothetical protein
MIAWGRLIPAGARLSALAKIALLAVCLIAIWPVHGWASDDLLKGKVQENGKAVRLARPKDPPPLVPLTPALVGTEKPPAKPPISLGVNTNDFVFSFSPQVPKTADVKGGKADGKVLDGDAENKELVIAWEKWHKRVSGEIYKNWEVNGTLPGEARVLMLVTREGGIDVRVENVQIPEDFLAMMHETGGFTEAELSEEFRQKVEDSVLPLVNSEVVAFPEGSQRQQVKLNATFKARNHAGQSGYTWRHDDYERVPAQ